MKGEGQRRVKLISVKFAWGKKEEEGSRNGKRERGGEKGAKWRGPRGIGNVRMKERRKGRWTELNLTQGPTTDRRVVDY